MTDVDELVAWLPEQLDEDEQVARAAAGGDDPAWTYDRETFTVSSAAGWQIAARKGPDGRSPLNDVDGTHIARMDPAHVLDLVAAHRWIAELHRESEDKHGDCHICFQPWPCDTLLALAAGYRTRPGYREEWAPAPR